MNSPDRQETILVVDDTPSTLEVLQRSLTAEGYITYTAPNAVDALGFLDGNAIDLVITDLKMPKLSGIDLIRHIRENYKNVAVMMITGYATVESAVEAVKSGAEEYVSKPFTDAELFAAVRRVLDKLKRRREAARRPVSRPDRAHGLVGESHAMQKVFAAIHKASSTSATVLITGESGSGKELVARAIHYGSARASAPFVPVNCGGIPEGLLESELFGYVRGAFTGAHESRAGFFQTADGGTIFLDEIGETSVAMQVKLLRVLQDKEVRMVGDSRGRKVDVRIIAATNKDLPGLIQSRVFREELYYRINVVAIEVPPLRARVGDIPLLVRHFAEKFASELRKPVPRFSERAMAALQDYAWPGNARELENAIQRLVVMNDDEVIEVPDLPSSARFSAQRTTVVNRTLAEVEAEHIRNVLASTGGNKTRAAQILGIDRKTLRKKTIEYHLDP
ncbi:sigma-54-dependent transcriptional regulator [Anaerobaca lacustris]|uniref:Sigma-54 dependent transcriptional regulator n=1 Tax=Anaerobaca lacustris TaxID=3044600 RepID=A0AAW6U6X0_9BACT|nr:sigma-54 dependent transcriptional regulator [Sedimentisphaerales bacterium M17dextr]